MKFSVITVCLNSVHTIERTIQSVLAQKDVDLEYIIVDGGSEDGTVEVIRKYEKNITYWVSEHDEGLYDAMNKGMHLASGDVVSFLNSDDWYEEDIFKEIEDAFHNNDCEIVSGRAAWIKDGQIAGYSPGKITESDIYFKMIYIHPALFVKRDLFLRYGDFDLQYRVCADYEWLLRVYTSGVTVKFINFVTTDFTLGGLSSDSKCAEETKEICLKYLPKELQSIYYDKIIDTYKSNMGLSRYKHGIEYVKKRTGQRERLKKLLYEKLDLPECCDLFGTGLRAHECVDLMKILDVKIDRVYDNSKEKQGKKYWGIAVEKPEKTTDGNMWIIASILYEKEMEHQVNELGIEKYVVFSDIIKVVSDFMIMNEEQKSLKR